MPLSDPLSIRAPFSETSSIAMSSETSKSFGWSLIQAFESPLPFRDKIRDGLSLVLLIALVICFWQPLAALYNLTKTQDHYSHIVLIPLVSLYALYLNRKAIFSSKTWSPWLGMFVVGFGMLWVWRAEFVDYGADVLTVQMLTFVTMCWGIFMFCYGISAFWACSFGLLFLLCIVPFPIDMLNTLIAFLQRNSAEVTDVVFSLLGIPFFREGFIFALPNIKIHIAQECSGIRSTLSLLITTLVVGHFFLRSVWGKWALVAVVVPLAIIKNAFRIVALTLLANYVDPSFITDSALHRYGGIPLFALSVVVLLALAWLLSNMEKRAGYYLSDHIGAKV